MQFSASLLHLIHSVYGDFSVFWLIIFKQKFRNGEFSAYALPYQCYLLSFWDDKADIIKNRLSVPVTEIAR